MDAPDRRSVPWTCRARLQAGRLPRSDALELLDSPGAVRDDLAGNLRDLRRLNRWFAGTSLALEYVTRFAVPHSTVLDVGTGSADIPRALYDWSAHHAVPLSIEACDHSAEVLEIAHTVVRGTPITLFQADALKLPLPDRSRDIVTCCLTLHHLDPDGASVALGEMARVARRALIVVDLERTASGYVATWLATHLLAMNRLTRHDGPLSVLRAYTAAEITELARDAGLAQAEVHRRCPFRVALIATI